MSVEIQFPFEFVVDGTPVSLQAHRKESIHQWKERIVEASKHHLPQGHFATELPVAATIFYFPDAEMQGDIDNIVKPILDALKQHIYIDDHQVQRLVIQKFEPGNVFQFASPSVMLGEALVRQKPALYIKLSNDPFEDLT